MYTTEPPVAGALQAQVVIPVKPVTLKQLFLEPAMDATPDRMSHCSELSDSALRCSFEAAYAELDGAEAPPSADMVAELESGLLPVCGLESHERGIVLLRKSLAAGRDEQDWMPTQMSSPSPRWGGQDDWQHMRPCICCPHRRLCRMILSSFLLLISETQTSKRQTPKKIVFWFLEV